jgi:hypothetical protein
VESNAGFDAVDASEFAVVFVNTPWSATASVGRMSFAGFLLDNSLSENGIRVDYFVIRDESMDCFKTWIRRFDSAKVWPLGPVPIGAGSVLWLKRGALVDFASHANNLSPGEFGDRTEAASHSNVSEHQRQVNKQDSPDVANAKAKN